MEEILGGKNSNRKRKETEIAQKGLTVIKEIHLAGRNYELG